MKNIGIYGGTFNPIHLGHLKLAQDLLDELSLTEVIFIPCANPPHKNDCKVSAEHRAAMVEIAIKNKANFSCNRLELDREGKSYTADTLEILRKYYSVEQPLSFIIGMDSFNTLEKWKYLDKIAAFAHLIVCQRGKFIPSENNIAYKYFQRTTTPQDLIKKPNGLIYFHEKPQIVVSSTQIRDKIAKKESVIEYLPKEIEEYIATNGLYSGRI